MIYETIVTKLGYQGDGIVSINDNIYHIPYTLPDEIIKVELLDNNNNHNSNKKKAKLIEIVKPSPFRVVPPCPFYTVCGGCKLQHLNKEAYKNFKLSLAPEASNIFMIDDKSRRRATFCGDGVNIGFNEEKNHNVIKINNCLLLNDTLNKCLSALQAIAVNLGKVSINATDTDNGVDLAIYSKSLSPSPELIQQLGAFASKNNITRISLNDSPVLTISNPTITICDKKIPFIAGSFLQPSIDGQNTLISLVQKAFPKKSKIVDLFCGCGTFAYGLWERGHKVTGFDLITNAPFIKRDLDKNPLTYKELNEYKGIVFDPPRAGAERLALQIAKSKVPIVVAVSCNPTTFKRDRDVLEKYGYSLVELNLVDQFIYSAHIELVAIFHKK